MTKPRNLTAKIPRRRSRGVDPAHPVYELDVWLVGSQPPIWRSVAVPAEFTLEQVHYVIQAVMSWEDYHLHQFETRSGRRFEPEPEQVSPQWSDLPTNLVVSEEEADSTLRDVFEDLKEVLCYEYDFGDGWAHGIKIIKTHADATRFDHLPICLAGERAGPPEDSGGVYGYEEKLEILRNPDPDDDWHEEVVEWMGGTDFDAEAFDLAAVNRWLRDA